MKFFTENLSAKIFSLLIALLLWVALLDEPELIETVSVPVEYRNLNASLDLSPDAPSRIQLQVRGPRSRLGEVNSENTNIVLDLGPMRQASARTFTITPDTINLPARVSLVRAMPSQVRVVLERRLSKEVPVNPTFVAAAGVRVLSTQVLPATVRVIGPESSVNAANFLGTEPIDLLSVDPTKPVRVNVLLADPELSLSGSALVSVRLSLEKLP